MSFEDDFLKGQQDCQEGISHKVGNSEAYDRGYGSAYEQQAILDEMTVKQNERIAL